MSFTIHPKDLSGFTVADIPNQVHTGKPIIPAVTVSETEGGTPLVQGQDFDVIDLQNNTDPGNASLTIQGKGNYTGKIEMCPSASSPPLPAST